MVDGMQVLWACFDTPALIFPDAEVRSWPSEVREMVIRHGLIVEAGCLDRIACPDCPDGHVEEVIERRGADGRLRYYIPCPHSLRVEIPPAALRRRTLNVEKTVTTVASAMSMRGRPLAIVPGRLWRLGKTQWQGVSREVLLARGLAWADGEAVARHVGTGGRPIILVADQTPPADLWPGRVPAVLLLSRVASLGATGIKVDATHMMMLVKDADATAEAGQVLPLDVKQKKLLVRRQVKAEIEAHLEDDVLVAAYKEFNSLRGDSHALTERLARTITKDKVYGAVQRAGGVKAVARTANSQSVRRIVVSQRRDSGRKILQRTQHPEPE